MICSSITVPARELFAKGLTSAIARRKAQHQQAGYGGTYILQLCE